MQVSIVIAGCNKIARVGACKRSQKDLTNLDLLSLLPRGKIIKVDASEIATRDDRLIQKLDFPVLHDAAFDGRWLNCMDMGLHVWRS